VRMGPAAGLSSGSNRWRPLFPRPRACAPGPLGPAGPLAPGPVILRSGGTQGASSAVVGSGRLGHECRRSLPLLLAPAPSCA